MNTAYPRSAVFPGSFDPFTLGHYEIVQRALPLFDRLVIAIGSNSQKKTLYSLEKRLALIQKLFKDEPKVSVAAFGGLTAEFCREQKIPFLLRGLRSSADFDYEKSIAQLNHAINTEVDTVFLISSPHLSHISSTIVREIIMNKGDASAFVPAAIQADL
ncbi:MAG: pantetheine-phosphate adenylyltransferase [Sphingobacteriales bacterium]|nr:pantetheine-phosphate adenylyltransferase [Sphingobacteriales bacterium]